MRERIGLQWLTCRQYGLTTEVQRRHDSRRGTAVVEAQRVSLSSRKGEWQRARVGGILFGDNFLILTDLIPLVKFIENSYFPTESLSVGKFHRKFKTF